MLLFRICLLLFLPFWSLATQDGPVKNTEESLTVIDLRSTSKPLDEYLPSVSIRLSNRKSTFY